MNTPESVPDVGAVKVFFLGKMREPEGPLTRTRYRISYYLAGCFRRGARYMIWDHRKLARATQSHNPITAKHIARAWVEFSKTTPNWHCEKIRLGRSFRWRVSPIGGKNVQAPPVDGLSDGEIRARLIGYIRGAAEKEGKLKTLPNFMGCFCKTSGIGISRARAVLPSIHRIEGLRVSPRKGENGFFLQISLPHSSLPVGSPSGRKKNTETTGARGAPDFTGQDSGPLRGPPSALRAGCGLRPPGIAVNGRWISSRRLLSLACYLAHGPMRDAFFDGLLVRWRFAHSRNLAFNALRAGHSTADIAGAWAAGVARSHADARDKNERTPREPSAAVSYAWKILNDGQTKEALWAKFFASDPANIAARKLAAQANRKRVRISGDPAPVAVVSGPENSGPDSVAESVELRARRLCEYLAKKGIAPGEFVNMSWTMRERFEAAAAREAAKHARPEV